MTAINVKGKLVDRETRCEHYHSQTDIIAIQFYCCGTYYPCYQCHKECADHDIQRWPRDKFNEKAILCGKCEHTLTIEEYLNSRYTCPVCKSSFNEGCALHYDLYFEKKD